MEQAYQLILGRLQLTGPGVSATKAPNSRSLEPGVEPLRALMLCCALATSRACTFIGGKASDLSNGNEWRARIKGSARVSFCDSRRPSSSICVCEWGRRVGCGVRNAEVSRVRRGDSSPAAGHDCDGIPNGLRCAQGACDLDPTVEGESRILRRVGAN